MQDHLIICGMGQVGYRIAELLQELGEPFVVLAREIRPEWVDLFNKGGIRLIMGDARAESCLQEANIETAKGILVVTSNDLVNIQIAADAQRLNPAIGLIVRVFDHDIAERIGREMGVRDVLSPALLTAPVFVAAALGEEMLRAFSIDDCPVDVLRLPITAKTPGAGEMLDEFCARRDLIPLAVRRAPDSEIAHSITAETLREAAASDHNQVDGDAIRMERPLRDGDELIVAASGTATERLRRGGYLPLHNVPSGSRWHTAFLATLHAPLTPFTSLQRAWRSAPTVLRRAFYALLLVVGVSIIIFHYALPMSWIDATYFVCSIMSTVGFGDYNLRSAPAWLKLFGCFVMVAGATLVALVFGIVTDFVVSARVNQALGRRQSHLSNHLVVVGLGDVGTRVTEALRRMKQTVIAIERNIDHESVPSLADDLYVIVGDANRPRVMEQANIAQARAIIVTTTNDLESLRIAHLAERFNPKIRSVIRIYDSQLATKLAGSLGIDRAVNSAATAAATFVACTIDRQTEHGFTLGKRLFLLRWMLPEEISRHGMVGATFEELRHEGVAVILKRTGSGQLAHTTPITYSDGVDSGCSLLVLEEYNATLRSCIPPTVRPYQDSATL